MSDKKDIVQETKAEILKLVGTIDPDLVGDIAKLLEAAELKHNQTLKEIHSNSSKNNESNINTDNNIENAETKLENENENEIKTKNNENEPKLKNDESKEDIPLSKNDSKKNKPQLSKPKTLPIKSNKKSDKKQPNLNKSKSIKNGSDSKKKKNNNIKLGKAIPPAKYAKTNKKEVNEIQITVTMIDPITGQAVWADDRIIKILLFTKKRKKTVENFMSLLGIGKRNKNLKKKNKKGYYCYVSNDVTKNKGIIHRIDQDGGIIQGGDVLNHDATGNISIYGGIFKNENTTKDYFDHAPYVLSMANMQRDQNSCQFFFTTKSRSDLNYNHCIFGYVADAASQDALKDILVDSFRQHNMANDVQSQLKMLEVIASGTPTEQIHFIKATNK